MEECADLGLILDWVAKPELGMDQVLIAPAHAIAREVALIHKVRNDALRSPLRYADPAGDVTQPRVRIGGDAEQNVRVVSKERPVFDGREPTTGLPSRKTSADVHEQPASSFGWRSGGRCRIAAMTQDAMAEMLSNWKKMSDQVMAAWGKSMAAGAKSDEGAAAMQEMERAYLGMRTLMGQAAKTAYEPLVSAAGAVPLSEFQRLADQVHTILLRMDRIDDALTALRASLHGASPAAAPPAGAAPAAKKPKKRLKKA